MAKFLTEELNVRLLDNDRIWVVDSPLLYESDILSKTVEVPAGFQTDFASVPRVPIAYMFFGDRAHREAVIHDYLYRIDAVPAATFSEANNVFLEAMKVRGKSIFVQYAMYSGVCLGGYFSYHKLKVEDKLCSTETLS